MSNGTEADRGGGSSNHTLDPPTLISSRRGDGSKADGPALQSLPFDERYVVTGKLGEGGMGEVRLVEDRQIGRAVAFKVLHARCSEPDDEARFVREARIQGQLEHPSVVPVYDLGIDLEGRAFFSMRRVRGATLEQILTALRAGDSEAQHKYSRRRLLNALLQVCLAVEFAHERQVLHRDLKPANIMLGDFGEVYVLDWGLAKGEDDIDVPHRHQPAPALPTQTLPGSSMGTPGYASPEQLGGRVHELAPPSDVYSLGAILFEVLTLQPLHDPGAFEAVLASTLRGAEARPSVRCPDGSVAPELEAICVTATAMQQSDRFVSARSMHDALERYLGGERDVELRVGLARQHAERAHQAAERCAGASGSLEARREAMHEIGRALALDPNNQLAMQTLVRVMNEPPAALPPEVEIDLEYIEGRRIGSVGKFAGLMYLSLFAYLPLLIWAGIQSPLPVVAFYAFMTIAAGLSFWSGFSKQPSETRAVIVMLCANVAYAASAAFYGPLVLAPGMIAINTAAFAMIFGPRLRVVSISAGCLAIALPVLLDVTGVVRPSYAFRGGALVLLPNVLEMSPAPTWLFLSITGIAMVLTGAVSAGYVKDSLRGAERHLYLYAWHIAQLAPLKPRE